MGHPVVYPLHTIIKLKNSMTFRFKLLIFKYYYKIEILKLHSLTLILTAEWSLTLQKKVSTFIAWIKSQQ